MTYAIGYVIHGIPVSREMSEAFREAKMTFDDLEEGFGFYIFHHSEHGNEYSDPTTGYLGVALANFDECGDFPLSEIVKSPTRKQQTEASKMIKKFKADFLSRTGVKIKTGKIDTYVVWSNS